MPTPTQSTLSVEAIKQHGGVVTAQRRVKVKVPGKHFPQLQSAETAVDYMRARPSSTRSATSSLHTRRPGARPTRARASASCACPTSDAIDDPDHKGFWTTLALFNRWRHDTYKENRDAELQYLDELTTPPPAPTAAEPKGREESAVKKYFKLSHTGIHTVGGTGRLAGKTTPAFYFLCKRDGCPSSHLSKVIKQMGKGTGQLYRHLEVCQPRLCVKLRAESKHSPTELDKDGNE